MRPQTPLMPMTVFISGIHLDRLDDLVQVVGNLHGAVGVRRPAHAALAEYLLEILLIGAVIGDGGSRVLELVTCQDANDAVATFDDPLLAQSFGAGHAGGRSGLATETAGADLGLGVENLLIRRLAHDPAAALQGAQRLRQIHGPIDLDSTGDRRGTNLSGIEAAIVLLGEGRL